MRDRLIEFIRTAKMKREMRSPEGYLMGATFNIPLVEDKYVELLADYLLAEGVIVPKLKKGDKVYYISASNNIVENKVYYVGAYSRALCYMTNGKPLLDNVFLDADDYYFTREEAEKALAERSENGKS